MSKVKTAISINRELLEETAAVADELEIPKSQVVSLALEEYLRRYRNRQLVHRINDAYAEGPDADETKTLDMMRKRQNRLGDEDTWK